MKSALSFAALALALPVFALGACQPPVATKTANAPPATEVACTAAAEEDWTVSTDTSLTIRATAWGPTCKQAVIALAIWGKEGPPAYSFISSMADIEGFDEVEDAAALKTALSMWASGQMDTTAGLPEWKAGDPSPSPSDEFGFYPEDGMDQATYTAIRAAKHPMLCFVQGQESQQCVYLQDGGVQSVGVQTFPG
jgi:hypothetical protein